MRGSRRTNDHRASAVSRLVGLAVQLVLRAAPLVGVDELLVVEVDADPAQASGFNVVELLCLAWD